MEPPARTTSAVVLNGHGNRDLMTHTHRVTDTEPPHLTRSDVAEVLRAAQDTRYAPLFALLVPAGLRRGEALALQRSDVDLEERLLRVRGTQVRASRGACW